jgi:hypothetical protein
MKNGAVVMIDDPVRKDRSSISIITENLGGGHYLARRVKLIEEDNSCLILHHSHVVALSELAKFDAAEVFEDWNEFTLYLSDVERPLEERGKRRH